MAEITAETLSHVPLFDGLKADALAPLLPQMRRVSLAVGTTLFRQGDPGDAMYIVQEGRLKVTVGDSGQPVMVDIVGPDQAIGELALVDGQPRSSTAEALADCELVALDHSSFVEHLKRDPQLCRHLITHLAKSLRQRVLEAETSSASNSAARLAQAILFLAERDGRIEPGLVTSALRKRDLAATIGTSVEWVAQQLDEWDGEGIIGMTGPRRLLLHDVDALKMISLREE